MKLKNRVFYILDVSRPGDTLSRAFDIFIISLIGLNVMALMAETVEGIHESAPTFFRWFEVVSVLIFTIEYILRVWTCTEAPQYRSRVRGRIRFILTPLALIDFLAILPFYLPFIGFDLRSIRAVRLFRFFRVMRIARYSNALRILGRVFKAKKAELVTASFFLMILLIIASTFMYFVENASQPEVFSSIPAAMWWAATTITTVGYGDIYPITAGGKVIAAIISILGIGMFALPTGILGAGFVEEMQSRKDMVRKCPHCGENI